MNILFFLTPKSDVVCISEDDTLRQVLEKVEHRKYSAVPIVSRTGRHVDMLTEGDLLWGIENQFNLDLKGAERIPVTTIRCRCDSRPVKAGADMGDLIGKALNQDFVPVLDDQKCFIGIITRKDVIKYFYQRYGTVKERSKKCLEQDGGEQKKPDLSAVVKLRSQEGTLVQEESAICEKCKKIDDPESVPVPDHRFFLFGDNKAQRDLAAVKGMVFRNWKSMIGKGFQKLGLGPLVIDTKSGLFHKLHPNPGTCILPVYKGRAKEQTAGL